MRFLRILPEHERAVVYTLGRASGVKGPGLVFVVPSIQSMKIVDLRGDVVQQRNVAVAYRVDDPMLALEAVADYRQAMEQLVETTFAQAMSGRDTDTLVFEREGIEAQVRAALAVASRWGLVIDKVTVNR